MGVGTTATETASPQRLPTFTYKGEVFTVDFRLREIRHLVLGETPEFVPFESARGRILLRAYKASSSYAVTVQNEGSISLVRPLTGKAKSWIDKKVSKEGYQPYYPTLVVEHRYLRDLIGGMQADGLVVSFGGPPTSED